MNSLTANDIIIVLRVKGTKNHFSIDPKDLTTAFDLLEQCLYESDIVDIQEASKYLKLSQVLTDACEHRIKKYRNRRIRLYAANTGSIEIIGAVAGVAYFVLQSTIGEALKDGFKESTLYPELKDTFKAIFSAKPYRIVEFVRTKFASNRINGNVIINSKSENTPSKIIIEIEPKEDKESRFSVPIGEIIG
ncbi:MAG: hypothetical protein NT004_00150 [Bacteroidetes bacterium]|nr:hypothetical protein [Bacteroidota bacterium]